MNYQSLKFSDKLRSLSITGITCLYLTLLLSFFSYPSSSQAALPDCKSYTPQGGSVLQPGENCLFYGLPLCTAIPSPGYNIPNTSILTSSQNHRVNCADLSDLPLCNQVGNTKIPKRTCVLECSDASFIGNPGETRGDDFAVHNRDCIRFCDNLETGISASRPGENCTARKCHQLETNDVPSTTTCTALECNKLTPDELNKAKFNDDTEKYCEGNSLKCFEFTESQLPYLKVRSSNTMCLRHNCRTNSTTCVDFANDDIQTILNKGDNYRDTYENTINAGYEVDPKSDIMCNIILCKPVIEREFRCTPLGDQNPTTLNNSCDTSSTCNDKGYCTKKIDCNDTNNTGEPECFAPSDTFSKTIDNDDAWFYRPQPPSESVDSTTSQRLMIDTGREGNPSKPKFCYGINEMKDMEGYGACGWFNPCHNLLGTGYVYNTTSSHPLGACSAVSGVSMRGTGIGYLCGADFSLYNTPHKHTVFQKGYAQSAYTDTEGLHKVEICARFNNTFPFKKACGSRECVISCSNATSSSKCINYCGYDVCKTLIVKDSDPDECAIEDHFSSNNTTSCMDTVGTGLDADIRLRAVKYGRYICSFLDLTSVFAHTKRYDDGDTLVYLDGGEKDDGTCMSGSRISSTVVSNADGSVTTTTTEIDGTVTTTSTAATTPATTSATTSTAKIFSCSGGKDSNDNKEKWDVWRTIQMVPYIESNRADKTTGPQGYLDFDGRLFPEQKCSKVAFRVGTPRTYNLANITNSPNLFTPPLYISNSKVARGKAISVGSSSNPFGPTDFHYPEIEVKFGTTNQLLSLDIDKDGYETASTTKTPDPQASKTISTLINGFDYYAEIFVRKENISNSPLFCLYRKVKDATGVYLSPLRIGCVKRKLPEIDNSELKTTSPAIDLRKLLVYPATSNGYFDPKIALKYLSSTSLTSSSCSSPASCTTEVLLSNPDPSIPTCEKIEEYKLCVRREECSSLNIDCMKNEVNINNSADPDNPSSSFLAIRKKCDGILRICDSKKSLTSDSTIGNFDFNRPSSNPRVYGWFNELCVSSGFESKLYNTFAESLNNGVKGKCIIDSITSPYLTDNDPLTTCDSGGKAPNCLCIKAIDGVQPGASREIRKITPREAGLCIDTPIPQTCPAVNYGEDPDLDQSVGNDTYGTGVGKVDNSHNNRNQSISKGHAEFPRAIEGMNDVRGTCKGFWKYRIDPDGSRKKPKLNCVNTAGTTSWESTARDSCVRYKCNSVSTNGPLYFDKTAYHLNYGSGEIGENKGISHGFSLWPEFQKTTDFPEVVTASSCITGFKKKNAQSKTSAGIITDEYDLLKASMTQQITGHDGGITPTRKCNQLGQFTSPTNICERITCPAIDLAAPQSSAMSELWRLWDNAGGAKYPSANASRSDQRIQSEAFQTGTCNEDIGYHKTPGGAEPTRTCDHLGNWGPVQNPCTTTCDDIDQFHSENSNNGFAEWKRDLTQPRVGKFNGCTAKYVTNPYPPTHKIERINDIDVVVALDPVIQNDLSRLAEKPERACLTTGGGKGIWGVAINGCINSCPGYREDSRIGVGATTHNYSNHSSGSITIEWPATALGVTAYVNNEAQQGINAASFAPGAPTAGTTTATKRTNGTYFLKRHCGIDGKWEAPVSLCAANNGQIGNATYDLPLPAQGNTDSIAVNTTEIEGTCIGNYQATSSPKRTCKFFDNNENIDETHLVITSGEDCEVTCPAYGGNEPSKNPGSNYFIEATSTRSEVDTEITGKCLGVVTMTDTAVSNHFMIDSSDYKIETSALKNVPAELVGTAPHVKCTAAGTWSNVIGADNCKSCPIYGYYEEHTGTYHGLRYTTESWGHKHKCSADDIEEMVHITATKVTRRW